MTMDSEERNAEMLLRPLTRDPRTASRVDVTRAIADGKRRLRTVRFAGTGGIALAVVLSVAGAWAVFGPAGDSGPPTVAVGPPTDPGEFPAASTSTSTSTSTGFGSGSGASPGPAAGSGPVPPTGCVAERLPVPAGQPERSAVTGADPTGRYLVGRSYPGDSRPRLLIWDDGRVRAVAMQGSDQHLSDITSTGTAVGTSFVGDFGKEQIAAWVYRAGRMTRLAGGVAQAGGINEREVIVGSVDGRPARWASPTSEPTFLPTPGRGWTGTAVGIDEDGTIVGAMESSSTAGSSGYVWRPDGSLEKLPVPTVRGGPATEYTASSIRHGWVAGWAARDEERVRYIGAPRWNLRTGEVDVPETILSVNAVNRHGWMIGDGPEGPALFTDGAVMALPRLGEDDVPGHTVGTTVSDDGRTIGGQVDIRENQMLAVRWSCR